MENGDKKMIMSIFDLGIDVELTFPESNDAPDAEDFNVGINYNSEELAALEITEGELKEYVLELLEAALYDGIKKAEVTQR